MEKKRVPLAILLVILLFLTIVPIDAHIFIHTSQTESSMTRFLLRKNYPYRNSTEIITSSINVSERENFDIPFSSNILQVITNGPMNSSWPTKSYNAQRISRTNVNTSDNPGIEKWRFKTFGAGGIDSGAVVDTEGNIYFGCKDFVFYALWPNGTFRWSYETADPIWSVPALAEDGTIYFTSCDHYVYALYSNGNLKWKFNTGQIISASPVISPNGTIYVGHSQGRVFALNPNGTERWHYDLPNDIYGSIALGFDGMIYIGCWDNHFYALNPNGTLKWSFPTGDKVKGVPSLAPDGTIYFGSWDGYLYALYPNGTMRWRCGVGSGTETTPAIATDGTIYVGGNDLYAVTPEGVLKWTFDLGLIRYIFKSCPAVSADGIIYVGVNIEDGGGEILAVNPDGTERWRKTISDEWVDASPAISSDGTIYIGSSGGNLGRGLHAFGSINSNQPPNPPSIEGKNPGKPREEYWYAFPAIDPDNNPVTVFIDWGDGNSEWSYEGASGESIWVKHAWMKKGTYTIRAKARDVLGLESNYSTMEVTMPYTYEPPQFHFIEWLLEQFPNAFPIMRQILKL